MKNLFLLFVHFILLSSNVLAQTVKIGNQEWMTKNLNVEKFRNGDVIPKAETFEQWKKAGDNKQPAWCYYNNDPKNGVKYGKLYNWYAVNDPRKLAPKGWHIPSDDEWTTLTQNLGGEEVAGQKIKSKVGWIKNINSTNETGFSGLPGGSRDLFRSFFSIGEAGNWWSSSEYADQARFRTLLYNFSYIYNDYNNKANGYSVRLVKD